MNIAGFIFIGIQVHSIYISSVVKKAKTYPIKKAPIGMNALLELFNELLTIDYVLFS